MVLEESLLFYMDKDATAFIGRLKKMGCHATKRVEVVVIEEMAMEGPLGGMIEVLEEIVDENNEPAPEDIDDEMGTMLLFAAEKAVGAVKSSKNTNHLLLKSLRRIRDFTAGLMKKHEVDDVICLRSDFDDINPDLTKYSDKRDKHESAKAIYEKLPLLNSIKVMKENGLVKVTPGGITLLQKADADEMFIERRISVPDLFDPDLFDEDMLDEHDIHVLKNVNYIPMIRVSIEPSLYFTCEDDDLIDALEGLVLEKESEKVLLANFPYKKLFLESVIEVIETGKMVPLSKIIEESEEFLPILADEPYKVVVHAPPETVKGVIDDMRKAGVIRGNDAGIRLRGR